MKLIKEIKSKEGIIHFKRWRVLSTKWFSIYIHGIYKGDGDEYLHNRPWKIWTMILWGGYVEQIHNDSCSNSRRLRTPGHMAYVNRSGFHKIEKILKPKTFTLAIVGARTNKEWGYMVDGRFIDHKTFRENKNKKRN